MYVKHILLNALLSWSRLKLITKIIFGFVLRVAYLNYSNTVSFFLWFVYTLFWVIKRYVLQPENRHFQCLDTVLTLARGSTHAWIAYHRTKLCSNAIRLTFPVVYNFSGKQHRIRQNNGIYITSKMALVKLTYVSKHQKEITILKIVHTCLR